MNNKSGINNSIQRLLKPFHKKISNGFHKLGYTIGTYPSYFIIIPVFISLIGLVELQNVVKVRDPFYLFSPVHGRSKAEKKTIEELFPMNYSMFNPSAIVSDTAGILRVMVTAKDGGTMLRQEIWNEVKEIDRLIMNITLDYDGEVFDFPKMCARFNRRCLRDPMFKLDEVMPEIANGSFLINYPFMLFPAVGPFAYGDIEVDYEEGILLSAKILRFAYVLKSGSARDKERARLWEQAALDTILSRSFEHVDPAPLVSLTIENESNRNEDIAKPLFAINFLLMVIFSCVSLGTTDWVRSKFGLGLVGVLTTVSSVVASYGLLVACGVPFSALNTIIPFLILGIGLDDQYVLMSGWHRTKITDPVPVRLADTFGEAAISITITSITNVLAFLIGVTCPLPAVSFFSLYAGVTITFTYVWFICVFGGCLAFAGRTEAENRHCITKQIVKPKSLSKNESGFYNIWCAGGVNRENLTSIEDQRKPGIVHFCKESLTTALMNPIFKVAVAIGFLGYLAGAIYGIATMPQGRDNARLTPFDSYSQKGFAREDKFREYAYRLQVVINETLTYSDPTVKEQMLDFHETLEQSEYVGRRIFTRSYLRQFYSYLDRNEDIKANITKEEDFVDILQKNFFSRYRNAERAFVLNENKTQIQAYRFIVQAVNISSPNEAKWMTQMRKIADDAPFKVFVYHLMFPLLEQFVMIIEITVKAIFFATLSMIAVAFLFMPHPLCCCAVVFCIVSIETGVIGYLSLWGVNLDAIAMTNVIMCIGFSVDFSAHISYAYVTAKSETRRGKIFTALDHLGLPIIQGGISTILAAVTLSFAPSYMMRTFFKTILLVMVFGMIHALVVLPVLFSLVSVSNEMEEEKTDDKHASIQEENGKYIEKNSNTINQMNSYEVDGVRNGGFNSVE